MSEEKEQRHWRREAARENRAWRAFLTARAESTQRSKCDIRTKASPAKTKSGASRNTTH